MMGALVANELRKKLFKFNKKRNRNDVLFITWMCLSILALFLEMDI